MQRFSSVCNRFRTLVTVRKRTSACLEQPTRNDSSYNGFSHLLHEIMTALESMARADDFGAVLKAIVSGMGTFFKAKFMAQYGVQ